MKTRILAVDDDNTMLIFIRDTLTAAGYDVTCVTGGQEAIDILKEQSFDGMILDFYMPGKDAIDVIGSMYTRGDRTPTIVVSSKLTAHHEAAVQGFVGITREVLKKPCTADKLVETVERVIEKI